MDDEYAARLERRANAIGEIARTFDEREHPSNPRAIRVMRRKGILVEIDFVRFNPRVAAGTDHVEKTPRAIDGDHAIDNVREVRRRIAGTAADVENGLSPSARGRHTACCRPSRATSSSWVPRT